MMDFPNEGYDEWIDALEAGEGYVLVCPEGHQSLPPRRVCPVCGAANLSEEPLPEQGEVETYSVTHVASPRFEDDAPYVVAIASFDGVRLTGQLRGVPLDQVETGMNVTVGVGENQTTGDPVVVFEPV